MARLTIARIRSLIRSLDYVVTTHAAEELDDDGLTIFDLEAVLLSGDIVERQKDRATGETKAVVRGVTVGGLGAECVVKIGPTGRLVVITIYLDP
jgi:hypothetical protein